MASKFSIILFFIWGYAIRETVPYAHQSRMENNVRTYEPEYGLQTVYTASAYIPTDHTGPAVQIIPENEKTQYFFVTTNKTEKTIPIISAPSSLASKSLYKSSNEVIRNQTRFHKQVRYGNSFASDIPVSQQYQTSQTAYSHHNAQSRYHTAHKHHNHLKHRRHRLHAGGDCIKCPPEKILIAAKGTDGVLIEQPKLFSCNNRAILNTAYYAETLIGSGFKFLLPHGDHALHGRIKNKNTGKIVQHCMLRYKVIVQTCGRFFPQDNNVKVKCDPGYIWGSTCHFSCRQGYLSTDKPMTCGDSLHWEGDEPECLSQPPLDESHSCDFIGIPDNGKFSCEYPNHIHPDDFENELVTPEGTICRVNCNRNYEIPVGWESYGVLRCQDGRWNATLPNLCQPRRRSSYY